MKHKLKKAKARSIIQLIKEDHKALKAGIKVLKSEKATDAAKKKALREFLWNLKLHSKAEENSLYREALSKKEIHIDTLEGFQEHALAEHLLKQLEKSNFERHWSDVIAAKSKVLAELVEHHAREEENDMLPEVAENFNREELLSLGEQYLERYQEFKEKFQTEARREKSIRSPQRIHEDEASSQLM